MPVNLPNEHYNSAAERWRTTRDATEGQQAVKGATTRYLPEFIPKDEERYKQYIKFAYYVNITGRTKRGLLGAVFRKPAEVELPEGLEYLIDNFNGAGLSLNQSAKKVTGDTIEIGRFGIFTDYPQVEENISREEQQRRDLKAYNALYIAEDILNWGTKIIDGREVLALVVLRESTERTSDDMFTSTSVDQYRVLMLNDDNLYVQRVYDTEGNFKTYEPTKADRSRFNYIPFTFVGSENNDWDIDMSPLFDLANINLAQYRNIADREAALRMFSQMCLHIDTGNMSTQEWETLNPNGVNFGASAAIVTSQGGTASILQAQPTDIASQVIKDKSEEMVAVGARLIDKKGINETAEAARINASSEMSVLDTIVDNVSAAMFKSIGYCGDFMGFELTDDNVYSLNREFFDSKLSAQEIMAVIQLSDRGDLTQDEVESIWEKQGFKQDNML